MRQNVLECKVPSWVLTTAQQQMGYAWLFYYSAGSNKTVLGLLLYRAKFFILKEQ